MQRAPLRDYKLPNRPLVNYFVLNSLDAVNKYWLELAYTCTRKGNPAVANSSVEEEDDGLEATPDSAAKKRELNYTRIVNVRNWIVVNTLTPEQTKILLTKVDRVNRTTPLNDQDRCEDICRELAHRLNITTTKVKGYYKNWENKFAKKSMTEFKRQQLKELNDAAKKSSGPYLTNVVPKSGTSGHRGKRGRFALSKEDEEILCRARTIVMKIGGKGFKNIWVPVSKLFNKDGILDKNGKLATDTHMTPDLCRRKIINLRNHPAQEARLLQLEARWDIIYEKGVAEKAFPAINKKLFTREGNKLRNLDISDMLKYFVDNDSNEDVPIPERFFCYFYFSYYFLGKSIFPAILQLPIHLSYLKMFRTWRNILQFKKFLTLTLLPLQIKFTSHRQVMFL